MKRNILFTCVFALACFYGAKAQDPQFSQFYANQVLLNPAFTGSAEGHRLAFNYRSQWPGIPGNYKTFAFSFDTPLEFGPTKHGAGISFMADQAGAGNLTKLNVLLNYAYRILINDNHAIRLGLSAGITQASIDFFRLRFPNQVNFFDTQYPNIPNGEPSLSDSRVQPDVNFGALYYSKRIWAGVTLNHLTEPQEVFSGFSGEPAKLPMKISAYAGVNIPFDADKRGTKAIVPSIMFRHQGPFNQLDLGTYVNLDPMVFGVYFRAIEPDAVIGLVGFRKGMFSIGYSYDYTISSLTNGISGGSHEISVIVELERKIRKRQPKVNMSCPKF